MASSMLHIIGTSTYIKSSYNWVYTEQSGQVSLLQSRLCSILYVDGSLLFSPQMQVLDDILQHLQKSFKITVEDDVNPYLDLAVSRSDDGSIHIRQPGLINKVISICGLEMESNKCRILADTILQPTEKNDKPCQLTWSYYSSDREF